MSQTFLRKPSEGECYVAELSDDGRFNVARCEGKTEREASDKAERAWLTMFSKAGHPTRKFIGIGRASL